MVNEDYFNELNIIFGSDSDEKKILPGILRAVNEIPFINAVRVHYASADNTPDKVEETIKHIQEKTSSPRVYLSGAGMSNVLTGVVKTKGEISDLMIGIPIDDKNTFGVSSFLSTSEKPPLNPVISVGLNNTYAALNIASKFLNGLEKSEIKLIGEIHSKDDELNIAKIEEILKTANISYELMTLKSKSKVEKDDVVITPYFASSVSLGRIDDILSDGKGVQIAVYNTPVLDWNNHISRFKELNSTGFVSIGSYKNAAIVASQLTRNKSALDYFKKEKEKKTASLNENKGFIVTEDKGYVNLNEGGN
jgi:phosphoribosylcarboxyaminoimidazole (NCAIR) mutase